MSETVRIKTSELEKLQQLASNFSATDINTMKAEVEEIKAWHDRQKANIGRPGFLYSSREDYEQKQEEARHTMKFLRAVRENNDNALDALRKEAPEFYAQKANFNTGTDAQGGYLVPDAWENQIVLAANKYGYAARLFKNYPMSTQTVNLTTGSTVTGYEVSETGYPTTTDSSSFFSQVPLTAKRFAGGYIASNVELQDAIPAFVAFMAEEIGRGIAKRVDQTAIKGATGSGNHFNGITEASGTNAVTMGSGDTAFSNISWSDLLDLEAAVADGVLEGATFLLPRAVWNYLRKEKDQNDRPIWTNERPADYAKQVGLDNLGSAVQPGPNGSYPVVVCPDDLFPSSGASAACAVFGDFSRHAYYGIREGMTVKTFSERWNGNDLGHSTAYEGVLRVGIAFNDPAAFAVLSTAAS